MKYSSVTNILSKEYLLIRHTTTDLTCSFFMSALWCLINGEGVGQNKRGAGWNFKKSVNIGN